MMLVRLLVMIHGNIRVSHLLGLSIVVIVCSSLTSKSHDRRDQWELMYCSALRKI